MRVRWWSVAVAGVIGSLLRWSVTSIGDRWGDGWGDGWPVGVLVVNVIGSLVLGWLIGRGGLGHATLDADVALGFCGGLTTMSAFTVGVAELVRSGDHLGAAGYVVATVVLGLGAARAGIRLGSRTRPR